MSNDPPTDPETTVWTAKNYTQGEKPVHFDADCESVDENSRSRPLGSIMTDGELLGVHRWCRHCTGEAGRGRYSSGETHSLLEKMDPEDAPM